MKSARLAALALVLVWASCLCAVQSRAAAEGWLGAFVPELSLVLLVGLCARMDELPACWVALLVGMARAGVSIEPASAVLAGHLGAALLLLAIKRWIDIEDVFFRALAAGALALGFSAWMRFVELERLAPWLASGAAPAELAWRGALATALAAGSCAALFARLPGLKPLAQGWRSAT